MRVVRVRRADAAGEHGRLGGGEPLDRPAEVGQGGRLHPVRAPAEPDRVQVPLQHLVLGVVAAELQRDRRLPRLPADRALGREVRVLRVLLGDGRAALDVAAAQVVDRGADQAGHRHAGVGGEAPVLRGEHRLSHRGRHLGQRDVDPVLVADRRQWAAVPVGEHRHLLGGHPRRIRELVERPQCPRAVVSAEHQQHCDQPRPPRAAGPSCPASSHDRPPGPAAFPSRDKNGSEDLFGCRPAAI